MTVPRFPMPALFVAWGFRHGGDRWNTAVDLAAWCAYSSIPTVLVQTGKDEHGCTNTTAEDAQALRDGGVHVAVWGVEHADAARRELQRLGATDDDWCPQVEGPGQRDLVLEQAAAGLRPHAVVTNYSGAGAESAADVDALRGAGVEALLVECYNDAGAIEPFIDLDRMLWQGTAYGWKAGEVFATMGAYHGETPDTYIGTEKLGRTFAVYLGEPMTADQWEAFGTLNEGVAPPDPLPPTPEDDMEPVSDTQGREAVCFAVQAAAQNWPSDKPKARLTVAYRISQVGNDDPKWNSCRDAIVKALDDAGVPK